MGFREELDAYIYHSYRYGSHVSLKKWEDTFPNDPLYLGDGVQVTRDKGNARDE